MYTLFFYLLSLILSVLDCKTNNVQHEYSVIVVLILKIIVGIFCVKYFFKEKREDNTKIDKKTSVQPEPLAFIRRNI